MEKYKILVVDDEKELRDSIYFFLDDQGFSVNCAHDGLDGLNKALSNDYDLILLDYNMPGMNGDEVFQRIKEERPSQNIVFLTGNKSDEANFKMLEQENMPDGFVYKPIDLFKLKEVIENVRNGTKIYRTT